MLEFNAKLDQLGLPTDPKSDADVEAIINGVRSHVLAELKLWQFYVLDTQEAKVAFETAWKNRGNGGYAIEIDCQVSPKTSDAAKLIQEHALHNRMSLAGRFATKVDLDKAVPILAKVYPNYTDAEMLELFSKIVDEINAPLYSTYDDDVVAILDNLKGRLKYTRVDPNGPKLGAITKRYVFVLTECSSLGIDD